MSYKNRFSIYDAEYAYNGLSDKEKAYVVNNDKLLSDIDSLNAIGDLDLNGARNSADIAALTNCILEKVSISEKADINGDDSVNILDLIAIKQLIAGL